MRAIHRECRRVLQPGVWFTLVFVILLLTSVPMHFWCLFAESWVGRPPEEYIANFRLIQGLVIVYLVWFALVHTDRIGIHTGHGLVLATFGLHAKINATIAIIVLGTRPIPQVGKSYPMPRLLYSDFWWDLEHAISLGGLAAYVIGILAVVFVGISDARRRRSTR